VNDPAGTTTISGHALQSRNLVPALAMDREAALARPIGQVSSSKMQTESFIFTSTAPAEASVAFGSTVEHEFAGERATGCARHAVNQAGLRRALPSI
jgi:hypothetical protein